MAFTDEQKKACFDVGISAASSIDDALAFADQVTAGATFHEGKWDVQVVLAMLAGEVRRLQDEKLKC